MVISCAVKDCHSHATYNPTRSFYRIPAILGTRNNKAEQIELSKERRRLWIRALKRV